MLPVALEQAHGLGRSADPPTVFGWKAALAPPAAAARRARARCRWLLGRGRHHGGHDAARIVVDAGDRGLAGGAVRPAAGSRLPVRVLAAVDTELVAAELVLLLEGGQHQRLQAEQVARQPALILGPADDQRVYLAADLEARGAGFAKHRDYARHSLI